MMEGMTRTRFYPVAAGAAVGAGAVVMLAALVGAPGSWLVGYVSEAGTAGQPYAVAYRGGLLLLALGVALLGAAFAEQPGGPARSLRNPAATVALLLAATATMAGTSAAVSCSERCPLPPFEPTTVADVVHTGASIVGMALLAAAMLTVALSDPRPPMRRFATVGVACTVPLAGTLGAIMLLAGRGTLGAGLERLLLVVAVSWLIGTSVLTVLAGAAATTRSAR
jgi:hypothetical protein